MMPRDARGRSATPSPRKRTHTTPRASWRLERRTWRAILRACARSRTAAMPTGCARGWWIRAGTPRHLPIHGIRPARPGELPRAAGRDVVGQRRSTHAELRRSRAAHWHRHKRRCDDHHRTGLHPRRRSARRGWGCDWKRLRCWTDGIDLRGAKLRPWYAREQPRGATTSSHHRE